jgi:energy-coupling factor transport system ATP-binding protein
VGLAAPLPVTLSDGARRLGVRGGAPIALHDDVRGGAAEHLVMVRDTSARPIVVVDGAGFRFPGGVQALDGVSLAVRAGDVIGIAGTNGAGKSTLARLLDGLLLPTSGTVTVGGRDTRGVPVHELARTVGLVFQHPRTQLFARTVAEELAFGPRNLGLAPDAIADRVAGVAARLGLDGLLSVSPFSLPGPARRMLAIASVLAMEPAVLVLDEPTTGTDHQTAMRVADLIASLAGDGRGIVCISHDMRLLATVSTSMVAMAAGQVVAEGTPREVFADEAALRAAGLVAPQAVRLGRVLAWPRDRPSPLTVADVVAALDAPAAAGATGTGDGR